MPTMEMERQMSTFTEYEEKMATPIRRKPVRVMPERPQPRKRTKHELTNPGLYDPDKSLLDLVYEHRQFQMKTKTFPLPRTLRDHAFAFGLGMIANGFTYTEASTAWQRSGAANVYIFNCRRKVRFWKEFTVLPDYPQMLRDARKQVIKDARVDLQLVFEDCWPHLLWLSSRPYARPRR